MLECRAGIALGPVVEFAILLVECSVVMVAIVVAAETGVGWEGGTVEAMAVEVGAVIGGRSWLCGRR